MTKETPTSEPPPAETKSRMWAAGLARVLSLSRIQSVVAILAGGVSIVGASYSLMPFARPGNTGQLVAIVRAVGSPRSVTDATVEVLTPDNALVATLTPDSTGRFAQELREGVYLVRVSHPRYAVDTRRIEVQPRQTIEVKTTLRAGSSSPIDRRVNKGMTAVRRALGF